MRNLMPQILSHTFAPLGIDGKPRIGLDKEGTAIRKVGIVLLNKSVIRFRFIEQIDRYRLSGQRQIERFAPGFRDRILAQHYSSAEDVELYNPNYVGGDISAGAMTIAQLVKRPVVSRDPWRTPIPGVFLSSSSTPPGTGVHGMAGYWAARSALRHVFGQGMPSLGVAS